MIYEVKGDKNSGVYFGQASKAWSFEATIDKSNKLTRLRIFNNTSDGAGYTMSFGWYQEQKRQRRYALQSLREYRGKPVVTAA
jgi:hypothetical protein